MTDAREARARAIFGVLYFHHPLSFHPAFERNPEFLEAADAAIAVTGEPTNNPCRLDFAERARELIDKWNSTALMLRETLESHIASALASAFEQGREVGPLIKPDLTTAVDERARDLADDLLGCKGAPPEILCHTRPEYAAKIASEFAAVHRETLEEAAKVAQNYAHMHWVCDKIAAAIRAVAHGFTMQRLADEGQAIGLYDPPLPSDPPPTR